MEFARLSWASTLTLIIAACTALPNPNSTASLDSTELQSMHSDPPATLRPAAAMDELSIQSHGARINGLIYLAAGPGPHPIVIFLHGYPGNECNLDLAQSVRRAGYNALYVDYRGDFGSGGTFSRAHSLEDVVAVLASVRAPENVTKYNIDPRRIALVGHSFGGWLALYSVVSQPPSVCVAAFAARNGGWAAGRFAQHPEERAEALAYLRETTDVAGAPVRANPDELLNEGADNADSWNYVSQASALKSHALLLIPATRDSPAAGVERHAELAAAIRNQGGNLFKVVTFDDDHPFSSHRVALADTLVHWLRTDCARTQVAGESRK